MGGRGGGGVVGVGWGVPCALGPGKESPSTRTPRGLGPGGSRLWELPHARSVVSSTPAFPH